MRPFRSLRAIALAFLAAIGLATIATGATVYLALVGTIEHQVDKRLRLEEAELLENDPDGAELIRRIEAESRRRDSADIGFLLSDARGQILIGNMAPRHRYPIGYSALDERAGIVGLTRGRALVRRLGDGSTLMLAAESEPIDDHDRQRVRVLVLGFGAILALVALGTLVLALAIRRNIEAMRRTAEAIVEGDLRARVPVEHAGTAFGRQARALNRMLDRIEALMTSLAQVSNDVAHDLRTPLARLHGKLARLADDPAADALQPDLQAALAESEAILALFAAILRIAEVEGGDRRAQFERIDLGAHVADAVEALDAVVEESGRTLQLDLREPVFVSADRRLLTQLIVNLVENAVHYTPTGTIITVSIGRQGDRALLSVADNGPGIPESERARALRRFGRLEASRHLPGHGLGLPLAQAIATLHRGTLTLEDAQPGLGVRVALPIGG